MARQAFRAGGPAPSETNPPPGQPGTSPLPRTQAPNVHVFSWSLALALLVSFIFRIGLPSFTQVRMASTLHFFFGLQMVWNLNLNRMYDTVRFNRKASPAQPSPELCRLGRSLPLISCQCTSCLLVWCAGYRRSQPCPLNLGASVLSQNRGQAHPSGKNNGAKDPGSLVFLSLRLEPATGSRWTNPSLAPSPSNNDHRCCCRHSTTLVSSIRIIITPACHGSWCWCWCWTLERLS